MPSSMLDSLMSLAGPQIMSALAGRLGESEAKVGDGLKTAAGALLAGVATRSTDSSFISQIFSLVTGSGASGILGNLAGLASSGPSGATGELGQKLLGLVLGGQQSAVTSAIAAASGLKASSAQGLLGMAAPLVAGFLGKQVSTGGLNASSFASLLGGEAPSLKALLPAGLGALLPSLGGAASAVSSYASSAVSSYEEPKSSGAGWLLPALLGVVALGAAWWLLGNREMPAVPEAPKVTEAVKDAATTATSAVGSVANSAWAALGDLLKTKLPNGIEIDVPKMGVENRLIAFITDAAKPVDKTTWFDFDRLLFDMAKATLRPESQAQLKNVAEILKAFPNVNIKVGGYTDNVGDKAMNLKLSGDRAASVVAELAALGIDKARLESEGYGDQHPVADNATEEGRAQNRRVSMRVTKK
ncbi:MAG: OmpA family protein [Bryobacterales bacterium]|nr:OmpA family protein [Bryobacterales bacterium]